MVKANAGVATPPGQQLPAGVVVKADKPLPVEILQAIETAKRGGKYFIAIVQVVNDKGELRMDAHRSDEFDPDYLMRGWQEVARKIVDGSLAGVPIAPPDAKGG